MNQPVLLEKKQYSIWKNREVFNVLFMSRKNTFFSYLFFLHFYQPPKQEGETLSFFAIFA